MSSLNCDRSLYSGIRTSDGPQQSISWTMSTVRCRLQTPARNEQNAMRQYVRLYCHAGRVHRQWQTASSLACQNSRPEIHRRRALAASSVCESNTNIIPQCSTLKHQTSKWTRDHIRRHMHTCTTHEVKHLTVNRTSYCTHSQVTGMPVLYMGKYR